MILSLSHQVHVGWLWFRQNVVCHVHFHMFHTVREHDSCTLFIPIRQLTKQLSSWWWKVNLLTCVCFHFLARACFGWATRVCISSSCTNRCLICYASCGVSYSMQSTVWARYWRRECLIHLWLSDPWEYGQGVQILFFSDWLEVGLSKGDWGLHVFYACVCVHLCTSIFVMYVVYACCPVMKVLLFYYTGYSITKTADRPFLSWQTWDLLHVMYYGFKQFCVDFLDHHPGYTVYPIRLNGSAIESFFSQLHRSNQLSSTNYMLLPVRPFSQEVAFKTKHTMMTIGTVHFTLGNTLYKSLSTTTKFHEFKHVTHAWHCVCYIWL